MKIDELKEMIDKDAAFLKEESHMDTSSLSIPELHSKYLSIIYDEKLALDYFKVEYKVENEGGTAPAGLVDGTSYF